MLGSQKILEVKVSIKVMQAYPLKCQGWVWIDFTHFPTAVLNSQRVFDEL